ECETQITRYRKITVKNKTRYQFVLTQTPFYPEGGGQIGDSGIFDFGHEQIQILDTQKENGIIVHLSEQLPTNPQASFKAKVDSDKRRLTQANHSATHLLHAALRKVLGTHVEQKGSLVNDRALRFDFSHFAKVNDE